MRLRSLVLGILVEGKVEDLQAKHPDVDVAAAAAADPSPTKKYLAWMVKQLAAGAAKEDLFPSVKFFDQHLQKFEKKDVNAYRTAKELEDAVKAAEPKVSASAEKKKAKTDAKKIYEDERYLVVRPDSHGACVAYGKGTQWCITMETDSYYRDYVEEGYSFYFLIDKDPTKAVVDTSRIAMAIRRDPDQKGMLLKFFDAVDDRMPREHVEQVFPKELVAKAIADFRSRPIDEKLTTSRLIGAAMSYDATASDIVKAWPILPLPDKEALLRKGWTGEDKRPRYQRAGVDPADLLVTEKNPLIVALLRGEASMDDHGIVKFVDAENRPHRVGDEPAIQTLDGRKEWWIHGERRREDPSLPVVVNRDGSMDWYKADKLWRREWPV